MSKKLKAIESEILPNHKEAEIWVTPTNEDGSKEIKYWNRKKHEWDGSGEKQNKQQSVMMLADSMYGYFCEIDVLNSKIVFYQFKGDDFSKAEFYSTFESFIEAQQDDAGSACWPVKVDWNSRYIVLDFFQNTSSNLGHSFRANVVSSVFMKGYSEHDSVIHKLQRFNDLALFKSSEWTGSFSSNNSVYKKESDELVKIYEIFDENDLTIFTFYRYKNQKDMPT